MYGNRYILEGIQRLFGVNAELRVYVFCLRISAHIKFASFISNEERTIFLASSKLIFLSPII